MKIKVTLTGAGGLLDKREVDIDEVEPMDSAEISEAVHDLVDDWVLAIGDTITITEG